MYSLKIDNISKSFVQPVLKNINLEVNKNEIFGFIGLNGQGKTTLIKIILDLLDQDEGEVEIFGVSRILPESRRKVCYLPEKFQPSLHQTGYEFLNFVLGFYQIKFDEVKAFELCDSLELNHSFLHQKIHKYSKGMTQKLGLMAVFLSKADLIILDEPMSGLDPLARINLKRELMAYKKNGKAVFFSSHILSDMDEICDNIAVLHNAQIKFCGIPLDLKKKFAKDSLDQAFLAQIAR